MYPGSITVGRHALPVGTRARPSLHKQPRTRQERRKKAETGLHECEDISELSYMYVASEELAKNRVNL